MAESFARLTHIYGFRPWDIGRLTLAQLEAYAHFAAEIQGGGSCPLLGGTKPTR